MKTMLSEAQKCAEMVLCELDREQGRGVKIADLDIEAVIRRCKCWPDSLSEEVATIVYGMIG